MYKKFLPWSFPLIIFFLCAFYLTNSVLERLGIEEEKAKQHVLGNLMGNYSAGYRSGSLTDEFGMPRAKLLASVITGDKSGAAKELCTWVKTYVNSSEFAQLYAQRRAALKPPAGNAYRPDDETIKMTRESVKAMEKDLADMKKNKATPAVSIQLVEQTLSGMKQNLAQWEDPNVEQTKWEKRFPADVKQLIRRRLEEYLSLAATVNFDAVLTAPDKYNTRKFVNPDYEKKSLQWKYIFRAGREVNSVVTSFVKDWLQQDFGVVPSKQTESAQEQPNKPAPVKAKGRNPRTGK